MKLLPYLIVACIGVVGCSGPKFSTLRKDGQDASGGNNSGKAGDVNANLPGGGGSSTNPNGTNGTNGGGTNGTGTGGTGSTDPNNPGGGGTGSTDPNNPGGVTGGIPGGPGNCTLPGGSIVLCSTLPPAGGGTPSGGSPVAVTMGCTNATQLVNPNDRAKCLSPGVMTGTDPYFYGNGPVESKFETGAWPIQCCQPRANDRSILVVNERRNAAIRTGSASNFVERCPPETPVVTGIHSMNPMQGFGLVCGNLQVNSFNSISVDLSTLQKVKNWWQTAPSNASGQLIYDYAMVRCPEGKMMIGYEWNYGNNIESSFHCATVIAKP